MSSHLAVNREQNGGRRRNPEWCLTASPDGDAVNCKEESECLTVCGCACKVGVKWESLHISMCTCVHIHIYSYLYLICIWHFPKCWYVHYLLKPTQQPGEPCRNSTFEINSQEVSWLIQDLPLQEKSWDHDNSGLTPVIFLRSYYWGHSQFQFNWF